MARIHGLAWHVHHDVLVEYCWDHKERADYIRLNKPPDEVEVRQRLFHMVKHVPPQLEEALAAYDKAWDAYDKALAAYDKAWAAYDKAWAGQAARDKARAACDKAFDEARPELERLHAQECPDCPWDGKTIFPSR